MRCLGTDLGRCVDERSCPSTRQQSSHCRTSSHAHFKKNGSKEHCGTRSHCANSTEEPLTQFNREDQLTADLHFSVLCAKDRKGLCAPSLWAPFVLVREGGAAR